MLVGAPSGSSEEWSWVSRRRTRWRSRRSRSCDTTRSRRTSTTGSSLSMCGSSGTSTSRSTPSSSAPCSATTSSRASLSSLRSGPSEWRLRGSSSCRRSRSPRPRRCSTSWRGSTAPRGGSPPCQRSSGARRRSCCAPRCSTSIPRRSSRCCSPAGSWRSHAGARGCSWRRRCVACAMKEDIGLTYAALGLVLAWEGRRRLGGGARRGGRRVLRRWPCTSSCRPSGRRPRRSSGRASPVGAAIRSSTLSATASCTRSQLSRRRSRSNDLGIGLLLILTTGGLCLLAPRWLLVAVPAAALNVFSAYDLQHTIDYHYWIVAAGAVALAGAVGAGRVGASGRAMWLGWSIAAGVVLAILTLQWSVAIVRQVHAEWPRRADRQAIVDADPRRRERAAPMQRSRTSRSGSAFTCSPSR